MEIEAKASEISMSALVSGRSVGCQCHLRSIIWELFAGGEVGASTVTGAGEAMAKTADNKRWARRNYNCDIDLCTADQAVINRERRLRPVAAEANLQRTCFIL